MKKLILILIPLMFMCSCEMQRSLVGTIGPAGGYIFYDCDADNNKGNRDGLISTECGWRYLEAAPSDITIGETATFKFGYYRPYGSNLLTNGSKDYVEGTSDPDDGKCTGTAIGTGQANTTKLITVMGDSAYRDTAGSVKLTNYAAQLCNDYEVGEFNDWFLPSKGELNMIYENLVKKGLGNFATANYWTSSEDTYGFAWQQCFPNGGQNRSNRHTAERVRAVRAFMEI